jgi:hypothetical protein
MSMDRWSLSILVRVGVCMLYVCRVYGVLSGHTDEVRGYICCPTSYSPVRERLPVLLSPGHTTLRGDDDKSSLLRSVFEFQNKHCSARTPLVTRGGKEVCCHGDASTTQHNGGQWRAPHTDYPHRRFQSLISFSIVGVCFSRQHFAP